jgi:hypothetical protein
MESVVNRATAALSRVVERPVTSVKETGPRSVRATVAVGRAKHALELCWVGRGWPADMEQVLRDIPSPWPRQLVLVGQRFSPGAIELLVEQDANWVDETGVARIATANGLLVLRDRSEDAAGPASAVGFRWSASSIEIAELLLARPPEGVFSAGQLAKQSGWSHPQTTKLLRQFSARGWVEKAGGSRGVGSGWLLADSAGLLDAWTQHLVTHPPETVLAHRVLRDPMQFVRTDLARALDPRMEWALSGWAGLELAAPFVTTVPVLHVAVDKNALLDSRLRDALRTARLREVDEGARIEFRALSPFVLSLAMKRHDLPVVSAPRLYADLRALGGRGEEAADHVLQELLHV